MTDSPRFVTADGVLWGNNIDVPPASVGDFWQWAFGNLMSNDTRGVFAEWLVAQLLGIPLNVRETWGEYDLITVDGVKIEVKASAYLQSWRPDRLSSIVFGGLKGKRWHMETNTYDAEATYNADIYAFCLQTEQDAGRWDALDLNQWRFFLLQRDVLVARDTQTKGKARSISLSALRDLAPELEAGEFQRQGIDSIRRMVSSPAKLQ